MHQQTLNSLCEHLVTFAAISTHKTAQIAVLNTRLSSQHVERFLNKICKYKYDFDNVSNRATPCADVVGKGVTQHMSDV